jgi:peptidoglycan/LPS O-acetylase OafA/YrhL
MSACNAFRLQVNDKIASTSPIFSTPRERRLWAWTLIVVAAIYSTLGLVRTLAGVLRDNGLLNTSFVLTMFLVGTAVVALALKARPRGYEISVALGIVATCFLVFLWMTIPEERTHLIE